ncbi:anti-sigma factor family protein [Kribbella sp. NPDC056345]|uniref:anti-sigma factor family protein n=1 Tax=Kribbella sp. NPDC056345 TaxID=3345789 RepID=UPI0035D80374
MNKLECRTFVEQVTAYLEGTLSPDAEQAFIAHISRCDGCEGYLDQIRQTQQALSNLPADGLPDDTRSALLAAFQRRATNS